MFALNYMMGSGYLTLPKAYADASIPIGVGMTFFMALGACVSAECILDAMDRAEWIAAAKGHPPRGGSQGRNEPCFTRTSQLGSRLSQITCVCLKRNTRPLSSRETLRRDEHPRE